MRTFAPETTPSRGWSRPLEGSSSVTARAPAPWALRIQTHREIEFQGPGPPVDKEAQPEQGPRQLPGHSRIQCVIILAGSMALEFIAVRFLGVFRAL
ncbi:hypothetical protein HPB50_002057 [Hyalomma asiaticum]|uniref:Uncharacterized protein n=1 Tax=Hyalomma asiaticum TaxID=266040 RepID=A0ACB7TFJ3_HYAAI|nr:hypothetical protein HPB50_002057 [Hyalomma asiaticum]